MAGLPAALTTARASCSSLTWATSTRADSCPSTPATSAKRPLAEIYREAPIFKALRDTSRLKGKCGACEYREICGGSRARAYALAGDPLAQEPCCIYQPRDWRPRAESEPVALCLPEVPSSLVTLN
jgi:radical SAM protein with 4Fe4S-binding SPASM domain